MQSFNPRAREERDNDFIYFVRNVNRVSIHAPVKSATLDIKGNNHHNMNVSIHAPVKSATLNP